MYKKHTELGSVHSTSVTFALDNKKFRNVLKLVQIEIL